MAARDNKSIRGSDLQAILTDVAEKIKACAQSADASAVNEVIAAALVDLSGRLDGLDEATKEMVTRDYIQSECRLKQSAKASPSASGTAISFIDAVSQDENGDITATRKTVRSASTGQTGVVQLNNSVTSRSTSQAATANAVKTAYDEAAAAYDKPSGGIPKSDLSSSVQASLGLADSALQSHQDISGKLDTDGDGQNVTVGAITASTANKPSLNAGEKLSVLFGKIKRWFAQLGSLAFKNKVGTGDVDSGTYGIDISGNAATATGPGDTSESSIESGDSLVIRKTDNRFSRVAFLNQASYLALTKDGQWRPIANLAQLMAIQRLSNENVYNFRIPYANYAPNSNVVILEFGSASTSMRGKFILSVTDTGNIELYYPLGAGLNDLLDGGSILSVSHSAYTIQGQTTVNVESPSVEYSNSLSMSGIKGFATVPHSSRYRSFGHVFMKSVAMATASMQILITIDLNYDCNAGSSSVFLYGYAKVENLQGFEP